MSNFVNSLLVLLLSWVRGIISDIWNMLSGNSGSFFAWLGRHWLSLVCVLIIAGVTADLIVYILRWHPQQVWMIKLKRLFRRSSDYDEELLFDTGYDSGIDSFQLDADPLISQYINTPAEPQFVQYDASAIPLKQEEPATGPAFPSELPQRRRRSDRHSRRSLHLHKRAPLLPSLDDNESNHYAYPAPPVHVREAFHNAVYPSLNDTSWEQQNEPNNNE